MDDAPASTSGRVEDGEEEKELDDQWEALNFDAEACSHM